MASSLFKPIQCWKIIQCWKATVVLWMQAEDGVLLEGRLTEYRTLFRRCESFQEDENGIFGTIAREDVEGLLSMLEHPLNAEEAHDLMDGFCAERDCGNEGGSNRISFQEFLTLFRGHLLDLQQITEYLKLEDLALPSITQDEVCCRSNHAPHMMTGAC